jgi:YHS domain-containing protein
MKTATQSHWLPIRSFVVCCISLLGLAAQVQASDEVNTGYFGNVAIKGYDPVSYFTEGQAVPGSDKYTYEWLGASWHFSSAGNQQKFSMSPLDYAPQYGGYCAVGVAMGTRTKDIDPEAWEIIDGKLYLNYSKEVAKQFLNKDRIQAADADWRKNQGGSTE